MKVPEDHKLCLGYRTEEDVNLIVDDKFNTIDANPLSERSKDPAQSFSFRETVPLNRLLPVEVEEDEKDAEDNIGRGEFEGDDSDLSIDFGDHLN